MIALLPYPVRKIERIEYLVSKLALPAQFIGRLYLPPESGTGDHQLGYLSVSSGIVLVVLMAYPLKILVPLLSTILAFMPHRAIHVAAINLS
jgi:hypothetical protein